MVSDWYDVGVDSQFSLLGLSGETWISVVIGAVVSASLGFYVYWLQKQPKKLDYTLVSYEEFNLPGLVSSLNVRVILQWTPAGADSSSVDLRDPAIYRYVIKNTGKQPIDSSDFADPISIRSTGGGSIHSVTVIRESVPGVCEQAPVVSSEGRDCALIPRLLNSGDWFEIGVVTEGVTVAPDLRTRIKGQTREMHGTAMPPNPPVALASVPRAWSSVVAQWIAGAVGGAAVWILFRTLWYSIPVVASGGAVLVTFVLVLLVQALLGSKDFRTLAFAVLVGLLLTASPLLIVALDR